MPAKRLLSTRRFWFCVGCGALVFLFQNVVLIVLSLSQREDCCLHLGGELVNPRDQDAWPRKRFHTQPWNIPTQSFNSSRSDEGGHVTPTEPHSEVRPVTCHIPHDRLFPLCPMKVKSFNEVWNAKCHGEKHGVNSSDLCSVIQYLSEVEAWCPVLPWRQKHVLYKVAVNFPEAFISVNVSGLLEKLAAERYAWLRLRISEIWPQWIEAVNELAIKQDLSKRKQKKILLYMGSIEYNFKLFTQAFTGGVLGELTQWSDLMSALYALGHELIISSDRSELHSIITPPDPDGCADKTHREDLDLIFTDIIGVGTLREVSGPHFSRFKCKLRVLDSFGTDAEFNYKFYQEEIPGGRSLWGDLNLLLPQFMTMYPHSPDNSFLGFAVPRKENLSKGEGEKERKAALIYGKFPHFWKGKKQYIDTAKKYFDEIHANIGSDNETLLRYYDVPEYVINHGIVNITTLIGLWHSSQVFIGLGEPFEGPAALEALANGCYFINPKFSPPIDRVNHWFFGGKPMNRKVTSQNPYAEVFVGKPFVHTVDINNLAEVEEALQIISKSIEKPHLPFEFTVTGMLERLNAYVEYQNFCKRINWPPESELREVTGQPGQSCVFTCLDKGLVCEPTFFGSINTPDALKRAGFPCNKTTTVLHDSIVAPSMNTADNTCNLQSQSLLFSCRAARSSIVRLCPCRSYLKEQVALCESCLKKAVIVG